MPLPSFNVLTYKTQEGSHLQNVIYRCELSGSGKVSYLISWFHLRQRLLCNSQDSVPHWSNQLYKIVLYNSLTLQTNV